MRLKPSTLIRMVPAALLLLALAVVPALAGPMGVEVWTDRGDDGVYEPGQNMRVKIRATDDAYLLVYEIDSEGGVNLLYPWKRGITRVEAHATLQLPEENSSYQLVVEPATGQGFIVAIASQTPFNEMPWFLRPFDPQAASVGYEGDPDGKDQVEEGFDDKGHVVGDPYVAMERIRRRVLGDQPATASTFATAYTTYYVHEQVRYPRYICNDCHRPGYWAWWSGFDPYYTTCSVVDFRVNWGWAWGPQMWTSCIPYYYYVVRHDCPPHYQPYYDNHSRFSSWDGWNRFNTLWGGELRRIKPAAAPVTYTPPAPHGAIWRQGQTPPGFVPPDVRRQTGGPGSAPNGSPTSWLNRDRGDGRPVWREGPRQRPGGNGSGGGNTAAGSGENRPHAVWRDWGRRGGETPPAPASGGQGSGGSQGSGSNSGGQGSQSGGGERTRPAWRPADPPHNNPPPSDPPRNNPPRQDPPRQDPPREQSQPVWRQPQQAKPFQPKGHGGS